MTISKPKTLYDEAIADVKKLKELAETQALDRVLLKVEPRIRQLVEQQLFQESDDEEDIDEASVTANVAGHTAPLGTNPKNDHKHDKNDIVADEQYEVTEGSESTLAQLADFARPFTDDRFVAEVYRLQENVNYFVTADKKTKLSNEFFSQLDSTISKLEDMYAYLKESYVGKDIVNLEGKLEKSYGLANAVKESMMKMRDLLNEETLTMKLNGLPDDVDLDGVTVDIIADEADVDDGAGELDMGDADVDPAADPAAVPPQPVAQTESDEFEFGDEDEDEDDEMLEISDSELKTELARISELTEDDSVPSSDGNGPKDGLSDFGDADDEGHLGPKGHRPPGLSEVRKRLTRAANRLSEAKGTNKENFARAMYRSAVRAYRATRASISERKVTKKNVATVAKNVTESKKLVQTNSKVNNLTKRLDESNLLNAKLIHANKLLRLEGLTKAQQAMVIDRLDEAQNLREVRLISESLLKAFAGSKNSVNESVRRPSGSASRTSQSGATSQTLNEGLETARWAVLAGIK